MAQTANCEMGNISEHDTAVDNSALHSELLSRVARRIILHHLLFQFSVVIFDTFHLVGKLFVDRVTSLTHLVDERRPSRQPFLLSLHEPVILQKPTETTSGALNSRKCHMSPTIQMNTKNEGSL